MELDVVSSRMKRALKGQKLAQVCAPLFLYLTSFRRNSSDCSLGEAEVRDTIERLLSELKTLCALDERLDHMLSQAWYAIVVSIDQVMASSQWSQREAWAARTQESVALGTSEGGAEFLAKAEEIMGLPGEDAAEVAEVMFVCMALGFQGELTGDKRSYEAKRSELYEKARVPTTLGKLLTPDSYGRNSERALLQMPNVPLGRIILVAVCTILSFVAIGYFITDIRSAATSAEVDGLRAAITQIDGDA